MTKACYPASFDPFTNGHLDILLKAARIFGKIDIIFANNPAKKHRFDIDDIIHRTNCFLQRNEVFEGRMFDKSIKIVKYDGLVPEYCDTNGITHLIRGIRGTSDYLYEETVAQAYEVINPNIQIVYLRGSHLGISSSLVWELYSRGRDVSQYVPYPLPPIK